MDLLHSPLKEAITTDFAFLWNHRRYFRCQVSTEKLASHPGGHTLLCPASFKVSSSCVLSHLKTTIILFSAAPETSGVLCLECDLQTGTKVMLWRTLNHPIFSRFKNLSKWQGEVQGVLLVMQASSQLFQIPPPPTPIWINILLSPSCLSLIFNVVIKSVSDCTHTKWWTLCRELYIHGL